MLLTLIRYNQNFKRFFLDYIFVPSYLTYFLTLKFYQDNYKPIIKRKKN